MTGDDASDHPGVGGSRELLRVIHSWSSLLSLPGPISLDSYGSLATVGQRKEDRGRGLIEIGAQVVLRICIA